MSFRGYTKKEDGTDLEIQEIFKKEYQSFAFILGKIVKENPHTNEQELFAKLEEKGYYIGEESLRKTLDDLGLEKTIVKAS